jgi:hypothetical protein
MPPILTVGIGHRFYSPSLGRWMSRDPMSEAGGISLLCFIANDAVRRIDPLGLSAHPPIDCSPCKWGGYREDAKLVEPARFTFEKQPDFTSMRTSFRSKTGMLEACGIGQSRYVFPKLDCTIGVTVQSKQRLDDPSHTTTVWGHEKRHVEHVVAYVKAYEGLVERAGKCICNSCVGEFGEYFDVSMEYLYWEYSERQARWHATDYPTPEMRGDWKAKADGMAARVAELRANRDRAWEKYSECAVKDLQSRYSK